MRRLAILLALGLSLAATAGVARGDDTFAIVPQTFTLPSAEVPNGPGLVLPPAWTAPPAEPKQLSYAELLDLWQKAGQAYGVPWNVLAAINKIESNFGRNMGPSSAGAIGWMQFMPSTWLRWGTDADGDGIANPWEPVDAVYSAARYLAAAGAQEDLRRAVFAYNHAWWYVEDVLELAQLYGQSDASAAEDLSQPAPQPAAEDQVVFTLDQLQLRLDEAKAAVTRADEAYRAALARAQELEAQEQALLAQAGGSPLLSDRLDAQKDAVQLSFERESATGEADRLRQELDAAQAELDRLQEQARAASFNRAAARVLAAPALAEMQAQSRYVFPVGGGPETVSVSRTHHDYPAADIAAPEGAPLYAVSDGTVLYAWGYDDRCGTGFTMQADDGQTWTYCHLSYLNPEVTPGARLGAGAGVGLVGSTGNSSGPHLHLQLQPASSYPQEQQWFQSYAGVAFRWQEDGETEATTAPSAGPVFAILQEAPD